MDRRLNWNEIRTRAAQFAREWAGHGYEKGETQLFYRDFFEVFGVPVRRVATFEEPVKKLGDQRGFIDLFWKGMLLVEQKSAGRSLAKAKAQAYDYFPNIRNADLPRYLLLSDFQSFNLHDLETGEESSFSLDALPQHVEKFGFIIGVEKRTFKDQDPVNIEAAEVMGHLHDALEESGYVGKDLERFLVRLVFCCFADDTGVFEPRDIFLELLEQRTSPDGSDVGPMLANLFQVLNTPEERRSKKLDEDLARFPYVNGGLFAEAVSIPSFDGAMRQRLIDVCSFDWSKISPAIFGSLFQSVMNRAERRAAGAHYTTEKNILKVIEPLFMDALKAEFERLKARKDTHRWRELKAFQERLGALTFFDPACGSGNFLVIAYREVRLLEIEVIRELRQRPSDREQMELDAGELSKVKVSQFFGIEIGEFAAKIAETALWMMDHIMNNRLSLEFGRSYVRIPLTESPHIMVGNALDLDWAKLLPAESCDYVFGNPPFIGHQWRSKEQQADMARVWGTKGQVNRLDYVTCWFKKAMTYAEQSRKTDIAFVATNSITQGEQVGILWPVIFASGLSIHFAHRTFQWNSEARGKAAVHCVIIGLTFESESKRYVFDYDSVRGDPHRALVSRINGYLVDGPNYALPARRQAPPGRLKVFQGSKPADGARLKDAAGKYITRSNLIIAHEDKDAFALKAPEAVKWLRPYVGSDELISGRYRWCLWLKNADPAEIRKSPEVLERLERVREGRLLSPTESVQGFAKFPTLFTQDRQPSVGYLAIPEVSSEVREYIPMAMLQANVIGSNKLLLLPGADLFYFGLLTSAMHMAWVRTVAGRLKSDYSYSPAVYNTFAWPEVDDSQRAAVEKAAKAVLDARETHSGSPLEVLYDPETMPPNLRRAHQQLDAIVDKLYRKGGFKSERERVEFLFEEFEKANVPLAPVAKVAKRRKSKQ